mmetsp:Transcript_4178/g.9061  ORF Transcript_4178/g.9061 Transcript_4178/m.9061 type:complete len:222 (+) Transcript_4178:1491-2156(+)
MSVIGKRPPISHTKDFPACLNATGEVNFSSSICTSKYAFVSPSFSATMDLIRMCTRPITLRGLCGGFSVFLSMVTTLRSVSPSLVSSLSPSLVLTRSNDDLRFNSSSRSACASSMTSRPLFLSIRRSKSFNCCLTRASNFCLASTMSSSQFWKSRFALLVILAPYGFYRLYTKFFSQADTNCRSSSPRYPLAPARPSVCYARVSRFTQNSGKGLYMFSQTK